MGATPGLGFDSSALTLGVDQFSRWRDYISKAIGDLTRWLEENNLLDSQSEELLMTMLDRVTGDQLTLAFVAEYSRGKSELINALFFGGFNDRIVPSAAGRTTMCPTEFLWDGRNLPSIRLLPIETRATDTPLGELRNDPSVWQVFDFDPTEGASIKEAIARVSETRVVPLEDAHAWGLPARAEDMRSTLNVVEVPRWRHAIVNYPHPLFLQGLRVIDTPGLNALGAEPELTQSLLPSAHALVFLLGIDTGVTASDLEIWRACARTNQLRFAVLNKIDGLWDGIRRPEAIESEINSQVEAVAKQLLILKDRIFPLSAQKALSSRIMEDADLLTASRIERFEQALVQDLLPKRYQIISEQVGHDFGQVVHGLRWRMGESQRMLSEQIFELRNLRGKNRHSIQLTAGRISAERKDFESGLQLMQGLKSVHKTQALKVSQALAIDNLKRHVKKAREAIRVSRLSPSLQSAMRQMIDDSRVDFVKADKELAELHEMMVGMHKSFTTRFGMGLPPPTKFSLQLRLDEIDSIAAMFDREFGALSLITNEKWVLARKFFESIALELKKVYVGASNDAGTWVRSLLTPIEAQLKAQQSQLTARMDTVKRVLEASDILDERLAALTAENDQVEYQLNHIGQLSSVVHNALVTRKD